MADPPEFSSEEATQQLIYLDDWEKSHDKDNENVPQQVAELRIARPHLEAVSLGSTEWDGDKVSRLINQHLLVNMQLPIMAENATNDQALHNEEDSLDTTAATVADAVTRSPTAESSPKVDGASTESVVKGAKLDFGDRIEKISKIKLAKHTAKAWSFLQSGRQSTPSVPCRSHDDEDLISFEDDPVAGPFDGDEIKGELNDINHITMLKVEDDHVEVTQIPEEIRAANCFTCGLSSAESLIMCPCGHRYCAECLCNMVKSSIRDEVPFPPVCCKRLVPIDVNAAFFDKDTLCDFFARKFGITYLTADGSPKKRKYEALMTPSLETISPQVHAMNLGTPKNEGLCYLCKRVNEKDSFCPDCCYRCNRNRTLCNCAWWVDRQKRIRAEKNVNGNAFDPDVPVFRPTNNSHEPRKMPLNGVFNRSRDSTPLELVRPVL
ncbi:hypothetical protein FPOAC2_12847 [Fusarium poae]|uniref:hypothetical protein n=1 Tax=Fusarium poae TaxID=36050 RepID=UPI001CE93401|nr:hypothetical protein FPOAC1_012497 [Fusarium poae]KAG8667664.1 hypothetical protein FPOAC1_012497 [Fusarium poae]